MALARNAAFNFLGAAVPALLTVVTLPYVVSKLGAVDFGLLTLVTAIMGYFALIDISVTTGSTKFVAQYNAGGEHDKVQATACFGLVVYLIIGILGMAGMLVFAKPLVSHVFSVPPDRNAAAVLAIQIAAGGFLVGQVLAYLQSLPGALMRYDLSGRLEASFGTLVTLFTVGALALGYGLIEVVALRVVMGLLQTVVLLLLLRRLLPGWRFSWPDARLRGELLGFSAYAFLSRLAALTYAHADRLLIGARVGVVALSYYAVASTLVNRVMALVFRLSGVMLPHASALAAAGRGDELKRHYLIASRYLFFLNGAIALLLAILAYPILATWLNPEFAAGGAAVMTFVALALWLDSITNLPSLLNDGLGHPKVTGLFAVSRAVVGLLFIWIGIGKAGIVGAAAGHFLASLLMTFLFLFWVHGRTVPVGFLEVVRQAYLAPLAALLPVASFLWFARVWAVGWPGLLSVAGAAVVLLALLGWFVVLSRPHRNALRVRILRGAVA